MPLLHAFLRTIETLNIVKTEDGSVIITRCQNNQEELDPILGQFLDFLEDDINKNPQQIKTMTSTAVNHLKSLVNHIAVDLETSLEDEEE